MKPAGFDMRDAAPHVAAAASPRPPVTHEHIFTVIRTLAAEGQFARREQPLRVLDIGCGDGRLIHSLQTLAERDPALTLEVHGFDIGEHGFSDDGQLCRTLRYLGDRHPAIDWAQRIRLIGEGDDWGYPAGHFDLAVSNQVIEHVVDLDHFLDNLRRAVVPGGPSIHVFPLGQCMQEAHCHVPFSHWIRDFQYRVAWIALLSRLGIGRYRLDRTLLGHQTIACHAVETAKFIECWTTYRSFRQIADAASMRGMATSYHFTKDLFAAKLRQLGKRPGAARYRRWTPLGLEWLGFLVGRALSSATLVITPLEYDIGARIAAEKAHRDSREGIAREAVAK